MDAYGIWTPCVLMVAMANVSNMARVPMVTCQTWRIILAYPDNVSKLTPWDNYSSDKQKLGIFTNYWDYVRKFRHAAMGIGKMGAGSTWERMGVRGLHGPRV